MFSCEAFAAMTDLPVAPSDALGDGLSDAAADAAALADADSAAGSLAADSTAAAAPAFDEPRADWIARLVALTDEDGYFEPLGPRHHALFIDEGPSLLVSFDEAGAVRTDGAARMPAGHAAARAGGWSHLAVMAEGETWFRDPAVYRYFDRLVDDAFFEDFDRVLFYGAGMGGYAAAAFAVTAPGATVLAVCPRATLDPAVAGWDDRHRAGRRLNFTDRYGFAPDMIEGAGRTFVVFDPAERLDAMHAALFHRPFVTPLRARLMGDRIDAALRRMGVLDPLIVAAMEGRLTPLLFAQTIRARRSDGPYLKRVLAIAREAGRLRHQAMVCRSVTTRLRAPAFRKRLAELQDEPTG